MKARNIQKQQSQSRPGVANDNLATKPQQQITAGEDSNNNSSLQPPQSDENEKNNSFHSQKYASATFQNRDKMQKDLTSAPVQNGQTNKIQGKGNVIKVTLHNNNQLGAKTTEVDHQLLLKSPTVSENQTLMLGGGRQAITTLPLQGSATATDFNDQINNYDDQTRPVQVDIGATHVAVDLQSQPSEVNVDTTQQEAQTSFRPSIRDSLEFKKISESILKLSLEKNEEENQNVAGQNYLKDIIQVNQQFHQNSNQHNPGPQNQEQQHQQVQQTTIQTQNLSTRRHKSQRSNSHSEHTQVLPRSGVTTSRISASNLKIEHQVSKSTASKNQQVLRQIYISVNTYDENKLTKDQQAKQQENPMLNQVSQGKPNQVSSHHQPQKGNSLAIQAQSMTLKRRRTSRERAVDALLRANGGPHNPSGSLIIQPMLLGVKAVSRTKNPNNPGSQLPSFGPGAYIGGISSGQQSPLAAANMQSQQQMQNFTEHVFDNNVNANKKERPTKRPQTQHNRGAARKNNNMKVKVKNERKRASFSQHDMMQQVCQTINCPGYNVNDSTRSDNQYQQAVNGIRSLSGDHADTKKLQFVIGPQVVQSLSSEQAAAVEASGAQTIPTRLTPNNDQMYFGQPIIIDADSKLGKHFLEENRQRKKFEKEQNDLNRRRLTEKWNREKKERYFGYLTDNQKPMPHFHAPIIDKKVTAQKKKEDDARKMEFQRGIIWNEHQKEIMEKQSQAMSSKQTMQVEKRFSQKLSPDLYHATPTPNLNGDAASEPKTDLMTPWSNRDVHSAMLADEDVKVDCTHDQQWNERPSTQMRMNSQTSPIAKEREKNNDSRMAAIQIAQVAEMARQMNPNNFHEIQNIIYKTLNQTDILNQPELMNTLVVGSENDKNPNAIVIKTSSLNQMAPILQQKSQTAGVTNHSQQIQISQPTTHHDDLVQTMTQDMNIEEFTESIKKMYLPFTLRKMYYKELLLRKPLFLGHSKKGVGFGYQSRSLLNERTCLAQHNQQLHRKITATMSPAQSVSSPVGRDDSILKVGQAPLNQAKDKFAQILSPGFQKGRQCLNMQRQGYYKLNGDQAVQKDDNNDRPSSRNKGIDMQSFGAMTGVDPGAVREIEQLIQLQQTSGTDLRAASAANRKNDLSIANMASGALTIEERAMAGSGDDTKKSKVIFSVKKDQPHNLSFTRNRDEAAVSNYQSKAKRRSNSKAYSSIDTGRHRGSVPASSAYSQPSSNKQYHEILHPRGKVSSPVKLSPEKKQSLQIAPNRNFLQVQTKVDAAKDTAMNQSSSGRNFIKSKTVPIRQTDPSRKNQTQHQSMNKKKDFELQYQTHLNSMRDEQLETARTPAIVDCLHHDQSLKNVNVSNVQIKVSKDSAPSLKQRAIGEHHGLRSQSNSPLSQNLGNHNEMPQQSSYLRSFTCADLNKRDLVQLSLKRRIRSAKNGRLFEMKITPDIEKDPVKQGRIQPDQQADAMQLNANSQSNFGRINLELIKHTRPEQRVSANFTQPDQQNNNTPNLPQQIQWMNQAPQDDIAETGSPKEQIIDPNQQQLFEYMCYGLRNQTTSPKILNLHLSDAAAFSPQRYPNQLPVSIPNSIKQSVKRKTENNSKANEALISPNSSSLQNGPKLSKPSKQYNSVARKATNSAQQSFARSPGVPPRDRRSRGSFYISEDSQRTLTPLSCKEDQNNHVQGQVVHRGLNKLSQMHKLRHRGQSVRRNKSPPSRLSEQQQRDSIHMRNQQQKANKADCTVEASHDTQTPQCTCSLKGSYKLDQLLLAEKQNSIDTQNSKNRVVFVVHNDENNAKKQDHKVLMKQTNSDLAHLPQIDSQEATSGDTGIIKIQQVENSQAVVATASKAKQREKIEPIRLENNALKKSASNNHYGDQNPVKRIVATSFSNEEIQENRMHRTQDIISAASKQMSPQSSSILPLGQILPAVNSQASYNQVINESYTELIQLQKPAEKEKQEQKPKKAKPAAEPKVMPKIQVKMRMSKNPNQCPPKMTARKRNNSIVRAQSLKNASEKQKGSEVPAAAHIISIQVQNDKAQKAEEEQKKKSEQSFINPNFSSLQPFEIMTTDDLTNQVLTLVEQNEKTAPQEEVGDISKGGQQVSVKDQISDKRTSLLTLNASIAQLANRQKRPQSQHSTGNQRFNRLQQLYSTQRGRNIASLVNSTTASKNITNFNNQNGVKDNSGDVTLPKKKSAALTHHQRDTTTMDNSINQTLNIATADPINRQNLEEQSALRVQQNQTDLGVIGRTATLRSSNDFVQIIKGNRLNSRGTKHQSGQLGGGKVDVGQSIQRFSIHLSPRNQILAIREQHGENECLLHKTLPLSKLQYNESFKQMDTSPDRTVTPLHHFLPTLPENQSIKKDTKNSSRQQESTSQAFQFSHPQSTAAMAADHQPQITYVSNLNSTNNNNFQHVTTSHHSTHNSFSNHGVDKIGGGTLKQSAHLTAKPSARPQEFNTIQQSEFEQHLGKATKTRGIKRPMTCANKHQKLNKQSQINQSATIDNALSSTLSGGTKRGEQPFLTMKNRIVRGLASRHFTANLMATAGQDTTATTAALQTRPQTGVIAPRHKKSKSSVNTVAAFGSKKQRFNYNNNRPAPLHIRDEVHQLQSNYLESNVTLKTPVVNSKVNMFDRQTTGSIVNSMAELQNMAGQGRQHTRTLSQDLVQLIGRDKMKD